MAIAELGPITTSLVRIAGQTVDRLKPKSRHNITIFMPDRVALPSGELPNDAATQTFSAPAINAVERKELDALKSLRGALYANNAG